MLDKLIDSTFPYPTYRPYQKDAILFACKVFSQGKIGLLSSPCGTGKSVSVLTAYFILRRLGSRFKLFALTRTRSQLNIYCKEIAKIKRKVRSPVTTAIFTSRQEMCPLVKEEEIFGSLRYKEFLELCESFRARKGGKVCQYYAQTYDGKEPSISALMLLSKIIKKGPFLPSKICKICSEYMLCPYEINKMLARRADIIVGNYNYLLIRPIRQIIFRRLGTSAKNIYCVFDEAHNLPDFASDILSDELSLRSVRSAKREIKKFRYRDYGLFEVLEDIFKEIGNKALRKYGMDYELVLDKYDLLDPLMDSLGISEDELIEDLFSFIDIGTEIRGIRAFRGESPASYVDRCASFLIDWIEDKPKSYVRYAKVIGKARGRRSIRVGIKCIDPSVVMSIANETKATILMSGTLWHTDYYVEILGLDKDRIEKLELPYPYPIENRLIIVDKSVTTKFEERSEAQWEKIASNLSKLIEVIRGRVAVYFPSYEVMEAVLEKFDMHEDIFVETPATKLSEVLNFLHNTDSCVLFGVARGKISEGVDMTLLGKSLLSGVVMVGLPYPKKTELHKATIEFFRKKFEDKAFRYATTIPCLIALAQSVGRLIRSPFDRGIVAIMDARAVGRFKEEFPEDWRKNLTGYIDPVNLRKRVKKWRREQK